MPLSGKLILLREEREEDLPSLLALRNDLETQGYSKTLPPDYTLGMYEKRHRDRSFSYNRDEARFVIEHIKSGEVAGMIGYYGMENRMSAVIGIAVHKKFWTKGVGFEAQELLLEFLFQELGLRVVRLWTNSGNPAAMKLAERSGFKVTVRQREAIFRLGEKYDNVTMDILRSEYYEKHPDLEDKLPRVG